MRSKAAGLAIIAHTPALATLLTGAPSSHRVVASGRNRTISSQSLLLARDNNAPLTDKAGKAECPRTFWVLPYAVQRARPQRPQVLAMAPSRQQPEACDHCRIVGNLTSAWKFARVPGPTKPISLTAGSV